MTEPIYPCLWFDGNGREAAEFYCGIFPEAYVASQNEYVVIFYLNGRKFMALNGGPHYTFTPASSYVVTCQTQAEIDHYWEQLGAGGTYNQCGWLQDKYGLSWQIVPAILGELMTDAERAPRVTAAFLKMTKFDIETLLNA